MKRIIIKYKIGKKNLYRRFYQSIADMIMGKLEKSDNQTDFNHWYSLGHQIDILAKNRNIYLK